MSPKPLVAKRSLVIGSRKTSITLESAFWEALKEIATSKTVAPGQLVSRIDQERQRANLSSAIRLYVLDYYERLASEKSDDPPTADREQRSEWRFASDISSKLIDYIFCV